MFSALIPDVAEGVLRCRNVKSMTKEKWLTVATVKLCAKLKNKITITEYIGRFSMSSVRLPYRVLPVRRIIGIFFFRPRTVLNSC